MICISLWQPWASALFAPLSPGASREAIKGYETRHWAMPDRCIGRMIAIHAAKRDTPDEREFWVDVVMGKHRETYGHAFAALGIKKYSDLPRGAVIGTAVFRSPIRTERMDSIGEIESEWGNYSTGRWAWPVIETTLFPRPIPFVGRQGFFEFPETGAHVVTDSTAAQTPENAPAAGENPAARGLPLFT